MDLVEDKLWIGGLSAALDGDLLKEHGITHVVTVDIKPLPPNGHLQHLFVPAHDVASQDLLASFESVFEFVETGKGCGGVLVHCFHGVSRSAALVVSYLQKKYHISTDESLKRLQSVRPSVLPNEGFMAQLRLYWLVLESGKTLLDNFPIKWYNLQRMTQSDYQDLTVSSSQSTIKCKTCRHVLICGENVVNHQPGQEPNWKDLSWVRYILTGQWRTESCRSAHFVLPPKWMGLNTAPQGKLLCPKCRSKIGAFSWHQNLKCPCGSSFRPAFYFTPSKVDFIINP